MTLKEFAEKHRLNTVRDECGETIIRGRKLKKWDSRYPAPKWPSELGLGQIYQYADDGSVFGMVFMPRRPRSWKFVRERCQKAGFRLLQNGDWEGTMLFDPANREQALLALKTIKAKKRRILTPEQMENYRERGRRLASLSKKG